MKEGVSRVLIVDDEVDICYLLGSIVRNKNLSSCFANSLAEAEFRLNLFRPSIIFLDNNLPDGLGLKFLEHVKEHYPEIKVIMITAHDSLTEKNLALKKGADFFIGKPFSISTVKKTIDDLLNRA